MLVDLPCVGISRDLVVPHMSAQRWAEVPCVVGQCVVRQLDLPHATSALAKIACQDSRMMRNVAAELVQWNGRKVLAIMWSFMSRNGLVSMCHV